LAILEYGIFKLPVVATNVGEISKIINSEKEGLIVESDNLNEFVIAVEKLIVDQKLRDELALALHKNVRLNFSEMNIIKEYLLWLKSLTTFAI
jgi:glycosyltransferase involved in cell wall biosynthesis